MVNDVWLQRLTWLVLQNLGCLGSGSKESTDMPRRRDRRSKLEELPETAPPAASMAAQFILI